MHSIDLSLVGTALVARMLWIRSGARPLLPDSVENHLCLVHGPVSGSAFGRQRAVAPVVLLDKLLD